MCSSDLKIDFKIKNVTRDKEGHYIMIKGSIQEKEYNIMDKIRLKSECKRMKEKEITTKY